MNDENVIVLHQSLIKVASIMDENIKVIGNCKRQEQNEQISHLYLAVCDDMVCLLTPVGLYVYETFQFASSFGSRSNMETDLTDCAVFDFPIFLTKLLIKWKSWIKNVEKIRERNEVELFIIQQWWRTNCRWRSWIHLSRLEGRQLGRGMGKRHSAL